MKIFHQIAGVRNRGGGGGSACVGGVDGVGGVLVLDVVLGRECLWGASPEETLYKLTITITV